MKARITPSAATPGSVMSRLTAHWLGVLALASSLLLATGATAAELLDRGVIAFPTADGAAYIGWRLLADDPDDVAFDVFRSETRDGARVKLNREPVRISTNFVDDGNRRGDGFYSVRAISKSRVRAADSEPVAVGERGTVGGIQRVKIQTAAIPQKVAVADLDGDGKLDFVIKQPDLNVDPYVLADGTPTRYWKRSTDTIKIEAYRHDGTFLWSHDLGWGIEAGIWYSPMIVYDLDGDGKAEVYCKGGPAYDPRDPDGKVTSGPEYLLKLDGQTGRVLARLDWPDREGIPSRSPKAPPYSYYSRNLMGVAYLDGKRPHLLVQRGKYTTIKLLAYDPDLNLVWELNTSEEHQEISGQGMHGMQPADIDGDGRDEIIIGAAAIDDDGKPLWSTGRGHPDQTWVGDIDPSRPGFEIFYAHEWPQNENGICLVDARTGETIWGYDGPTRHIHSRGFVADIDPTRPGMEAYGGERNGSQHWLYDAKGNRIGNSRMGGLSADPVWWSDSPTKFLIARERLIRFKPPPPGTNFPTETSVGRTVAAMTRPPRPAGEDVRPAYVAEDFGEVKGEVVAVGDFIGDWREEFIVSSEGEFHLYTTTIPATSRRVTLMQDRKYRTSVAIQGMGYLFAPMLGGKISPTVDGDVRDYSLTVPSPQGAEPASR
jgi:rhamnogalacturonan endolyase